MCIQQGIWRAYHKDDDQKVDHKDDDQKVVFQHDHHGALRLTKRNNLISRKKYEKIIMDRKMHIFEKGINAPSIRICITCLVPKHYHREFKTIEVAQRRVAMWATRDYRNTSSGAETL